VLVDVATGARSQVYPYPVVQAAWRPDGRAIAVADHESVRVLSVVGDRIENRIQIEREGRIPMRAWDIAWSPDGETFAANAYGEDIVLVRNESTRTIEGSFYGFVWTGRDEVVAIESANETSPVALVRLNATSHERSLEVQTRARFDRVAISPTGDWAIHIQFPTQGASILMLIDLASGETVFVDAAPSPFGELEFGPSGDRLLAHTEYCSEESSLMTVERTGVTTALPTGFGLGARFSPDGLQVAYTSNQSLFVTAADGTGAPVALAAGVFGNVHWSPDGSEIAVRPPPEGGYSLCPG